MVITALQHIRGRGHEGLRHRSRRVLADQTKHLAGRKTTRHIGFDDGDRGIHHHPLSDPVRSDALPHRVDATDAVTPRDPRPGSFDPGNPLSHPEVEMVEPRSLRADTNLAESRLR